MKIKVSKSELNECLSRAITRILSEGKDKKIDMGYLKSNRKGNRDAEREMKGDGFKQNTKVHKSQKEYSRKGKNASWKTNYDMFEDSYKDIVNESSNNMINEDDNFTKYFRPMDVERLYNSKRKSDEQYSKFEYYVIEAAMWARARSNNYHGYYEKWPAVEYKNGKFYAQTIHDGMTEVPFNYNVMTPKFLELTEEWKTNYDMIDEAEDTYDDEDTSWSQFMVTNDKVNAYSPYDNSISSSDDYDTSGIPNIEDVISGKVKVSPNASDSYDNESDLKREPIITIMTDINQSEKDLINNIKYNFDESEYDMVKGMVSFNIPEKLKDEFMDYLSNEDVEVVGIE